VNIAKAIISNGSEVAVEADMTAMTGEMYKR
jgi:hypothetical protein